LAEARIRATPAFLAALCAVACAGEQFARADIADRDSAGIRIIENRTPLLAEDRAWKLDSATIEIGAQEQDTTQQLFSLRASIRLSAGRIVIANRRAASPPLVRHAGPIPPRRRPAWRRPRRVPEFGPTDHVHLAPAR
jgi:hypothetical protein